MLAGIDGVDDMTKSEVVRPNIDWSLSLPAELLCWACTAAAGRFTNEDVDMNFCSMISDILLFFKIGFLAKKELLFERLLVGSEMC